jgi:aryl-alcohol dehydrogenase-like predicted oxidoreductase
MERKKLFKHLQPVTSIVLGCDHFGETNPGIGQLDIYWQKGGNVLDTARSYGREANKLGTSELVIGKWIKANGNKADIVVIGKSGQRMLSLEGPNIDRKLLDMLKTEHEEESQALGFEPDIWMLHRDMTSLDMDVLMDIALQAKGSSLLGLSNFSTARMKQAIRYADIEASEIQGSLAYCTPEAWGDPSLWCLTDEDVTFYDEHELAYLCFSSQAKGLFYHLLDSTDPSQKAHDRFDCPVNRQRAQRLQNLSLRLGQNLETLMLSFIYSRGKGYGMPIAGSTKPSQIESSTSSTFTMTESMIDYLLGREDDYE